MRIALTIAGSDPTGGAGLQADLRVFQALGVHGAAVVTALTVQSSARVHKVLPSFPSVVLEQLRVLLRDLTPHAVKIGLLATDDVVRNVDLGLEELERSAAVPIVIDPVLAASDGTELLERRALAALTQLIRRAALVTPNLPEAEQLTGRDVSSREAIEAAARELVSEFGAGAALVKGGHRAGPPDDLLAVRNGGGVTLRWLAGERIGGGPVRGTGCALASAITAGLALGEPLVEAVEAARRFLAQALRRAEPAGEGARFLVFP